MKIDCWVYEMFEIFVWEGCYDIVDCVVWFMVLFGVEVICVGGIDFQLVEFWFKFVVVVISVLVVESGGFMVFDWQVV